MKHFLTLAIALVMAINAFGQSDEEVRRQEDQNRIDELLASKNAGLAPAYTIFVSQFLPKTSGDWSVTVLRSGGFLGDTTRLVTVVNSDGFYGCNSISDDFEAKLLEEGIVSNIGRFIALQDFNRLKKEFYHASVICNDCTSTSLEISYRQKKTTTYYRFDWLVLSDANREIRSLYSSVLDSTRCE
jgi:hypothetical protein